VNGSANHALVRWTPRTRRDRRFLLGALIGSDSLALAFAVASTTLSRFALEDFLPFSALASDRHLIASLLVIPVLLLIFHLQGLYDLDQVLVGTREYMLVAHGATYGALIALAVSFFAGGGPLISRSWVLLLWALSVGLVAGSRFGLRRIVRRMRRGGLLRTRVAIIGASTLGVEIARQFLVSRDEGIDILGFLDEYLPLGQPLLDGIGVIGRPLELVQGGPAGLADEYILVPAALPHQRVEEITRAMAARDRRPLRVAVSSSDLLTHGVQVVERGGVPLVTVHRACITGLDALLKRGVDLVGATLLLILLAPVIGPLLLRAALVSPLSLFLRHEIHGAGGERTTLWLLHPRVTRYLPLRGFPSLLIVLSGRLSLVGPRPVAWQGGRLPPAALMLTAAKPGLTGPWRLSGPETSLARQATLDLSYVRNYTIWEDFRILGESLRRLPGGEMQSLLGRWQEHTEAADAPRLLVEELKTEARAG